MQNTHKSTYGLCRSRNFKECITVYLIISLQTIMITPFKGSHLYVPRRTTWIKIESSNQSPLWEPIKRSRSPALNCENQMIKNTWLHASDLRTNQAIKALEEAIKWSSTLFAAQESWSWSKTFQQTTYSLVTTPCHYLQAYCLGNYMFQILRLLPKS